MLKTLRCQIIIDMRCTVCIKLTSSDVNKFSAYWHKNTKGFVATKDINFRQNLVQKKISE